VTTILIANYLEPEYVNRVAAAEDVEVLYAPELLPIPGYANDHDGVRPDLSAADERRWLDLLSRAEVSFDFDWRAPGDLLANAPKLRWVQATSAGIGGFVKRHGLDGSDLVFTTAAGVHAAPLTEFALAGALHFVKDLSGLQQRQAAHHWEKSVCGQLAGRRATVVGLGSIGRQIATVFDALGVRVTGVGRRGKNYPLPEGITQRATDELNAILPETDLLVLATPLTPETENLIDAVRIGLLPPGAIVVNIARGPVLDEDALITALTSGALGGAALDVFAVEPLPAESPLWDLPNVIVSPHTASIAATENDLLTDLFLDNLNRYRAGRPMRNRYQPHLGY
jgi:glyoxylate/hydroxypyruvate reductase A